MLCTESETQLARLLFQITESEKTVERSRQELSSVPDFDPHLVFDTLDELSVRGIGALDLKAFLEQHEIFSPIEEIELLIKQYDSDADGLLSISDFFQLILPSEDMELREIAQNRQFSYMSRSSAHKLALHLQLEGREQSILEQEKKFLNAKHDFSFWKAFCSIDKSRSGRLSIEMLSLFLKEYGFPMHHEDLNALVRRIDTDDDNLLNFSEFSESLSVNKSAFTSASFNQSSPFRDAKDLSRSSPQVRTDLFPEVLELLKCQLKIVKGLEEVKTSLACQPDFTILDFFRLADLEDKGYIDSRDLESLLRDFEIRTEDNDALLVTKYYSHTGILRLGDFEHIWTPKNEYFQELVRQRPPLRNPPQNRMESFRKDTLDKIEHALLVLLDCERQAEDFRKRFKLADSLWEAFKALDKNEDGFLTLEKFEVALTEFGVSFNIENLAGLLDRYDKDKDGRVSYSEFVHEITPILK